MGPNIHFFHYITAIMIFGFSFYLIKRNTHTKRDMLQSITTLPEVRNSFCFFRFYILLNSMYQHFLIKSSIQPIFIEHLLLSEDIGRYHWRLRDVRDVSDLASLSGTEAQSGGIKKHV